MIVPIVYTVVFLLVFFVASVVAVRRSPCEDHTDPDTFWPLTGFALIWPITIPLTATMLLLMGIAKLAEKLAGGAK